LDGTSAWALIDALAAASRAVADAAVTAVPHTVPHPPSLRPDRERPLLAAALAAVGGPPPVARSLLQIPAAGDAAALEAAQVEFLGKVVVPGAAFPQQGHYNPTAA